MATTTPSTSVLVLLQKPHPTVYVSNLDWSIKKNLLRKSLYHLFSRHGTILDVIALRAEGLRGQAWIIFDEVACATSAIREEQGVQFYGKHLRLSFANHTSDVIARRDGTYVPKAKRLLPAISSTTTTTTTAGENIHTTNGGNTEVFDKHQQQEDETHSNEDSSEEDGPKAAATDSTSSSKKRPRLQEQQQQEAPSNILFASDLPNECNDMIIAMLFRQYAGFKECRMPRPGIAFIEFQDEAQATLAMRNLHGFKLTEKDPLVLSYGKS